MRRAPHALRRELCPQHARCGAENHRQRTRPHAARLGREVAALLEDIQPLCSGGTAVTVMAGTPVRRQVWPPTCAPKG
ncbi:hypothetical protein NIA69_20715 [Gemmiger formicilis]|nr:hypothetical protein [Gemmiger formicilis]